MAVSHSTVHIHSLHNTVEEEATKRLDHHYMEMRMPKIRDDGEQEWRGRERGQREAAQKGDEESGKKKGGYKGLQVYWKGVERKPLHDGKSYTALYVYCTSTISNVMLLFTNESIGVLC